MHASVRPGTRIITASKLEELRSTIRGAATALGNVGNWADPDAVAAQLNYSKLTSTSLTARYTVGARRPGLDEPGPAAEHCGPPTASGAGDTPALPLLPVPLAGMAPGPGSSRRTRSVHRSGKLGLWG
jgi:hypothetical protein